MENILWLTSNLFLIEYMCVTTVAQEVIKLGVILPYDNNVAPWSLPRVKGGITYAIDTIHNRSDLLPGHRIQLTYGDSMCSETYAPLAAIDMYYQKKADVFIGPGCEYALAPIARFSPVWNMPVITGTGFPRAFSDKMTSFKQLTRIGGSYSGLASALAYTLHRFSFTRVGLIYNENQGRRGPEGKTACYFPMEAIYYRLRRQLGRTHPGEEIWYKPFDPRADPSENLDNIIGVLNEAKENARVIVLCAGRESVRDIMLKAADMGFNNGEYVFINIDLFGSQNQLERPWHVETDSYEQNEAARSAYDSLITMTLRKPDSDKYRKFSDEVKRRTREEYGDSIYGQEEVNSFVGAFHDAVILYALALNETLEAGYNVTNGAEITRRMWNRSFEGITGNVKIDSNGDRDVDYSILNMNPVTGKFEVVGNFDWKSGYQTLPGKTIHWPGGREGPPPDTPKCGFDGSRCPKKEPLPEYAIVAIVLGSLLVIIILVALLFCRHYRLKAELARVQLRMRCDDNGASTSKLIK